MERSLVSAKKTMERGVQVAEKRETIVQTDPTSQKPK